MKISYTTPFTRCVLLACATSSLLFAGTAAAQGSASAACPDAADITRGFTAPLATVRYLADDALGGRLAGSAGERCAGDYIAARFRALGLEPAGENGTFFQTLPLASIANPHAEAGSGRNVLALLRGSAGGTGADEVVIIGAHYDHLGAGPFGSMAPQEAGAVHNGADDNASGVAAMLRAAEILVAQKPSRSVLFVAFTGEEEGLLGSAFFTKHPTVPIDRAAAMLNMDMVGRLNGGTLIVNGVDTGEEWRSILDAAGTKAGVRTAYQGSGYGPSDHTSFYLAGMPVLHFFTNTHADYHRPGDDWDKVDAAGLEQVARLVADVAATVAVRPARLTLVKTPPPAPSGGGAGSGAWLGTVPDFTPVANGVLLGGVSAGSPAEKAGLRKGDILVKLGDSAVADLQGFTDVLRGLKPGDRVGVVVLRDGREHRVTVTLGRRGA